MRFAPLLGPLLLTGAGLGVLKLLGATKTRGPLVLMGYAFLAGSATCGAGLYAASHFFGLPLTRGAVLTVFLAPAFAGLLSSFLEKPRPAAGYTVRPALKLFLFPAAFGTIVTAALLLDALGRPVTDWDGRAIWGAHARYIRQAGTVDAPALRETKWFVANPKYPVLLPVIQVVVENAIGADDDDRAARPVYTFFFPCFLLVLFDAARRRAGVLAAAVVVSLAAAIPWVSETAAISYSDLPLGCFLGTGFLLLLEPGLDTRRALLAGILFSGAILTKNEGMVLTLMALATAAVFACFAARRHPGRKFPKALWAAFAIVSAAVFLRVHWRAGVAPRVDTDYWARLSPAAFFVGLRVRSGAVLRAVAAESFDRNAWGLLPWTIPLFLFGARAVRRRPLHPILVFLALAFSVPLTAYLVGEFEPAWVIETTWKRFQIQMLLPLLVVFACFLRPLIRGPRLRHLLTATSPAAAVLVVALACYGIAARPAVSADEDDVDCPDAPRPTAREDSSFPASIDRPAEGDVVNGDLLVAGWSQDFGGSCDVIRIELDGTTRDCASFGRTARLDVAAALPRLGNCDRAGYEARFEFEEGDQREHEVRVWFRSPDGKIRSLQRRFRWAAARPR